MPKQEEKHKRHWTESAVVIRFEDVELRDVIGKGAHAIVYRGKYNGKEVAIKQCKLVETFDREIKNLRRLRHTNIISFFGFCEPATASKEKYLVLELAKCNLAQVVYKGEKLASKYGSRRNALEWCLQICDAFSYIHEQVIHYDLKPMNVLLGEDWKVRICDFGISRRPVSGLGEDGATPLYTAPEIILSEKENLTEKVDVYSFGIILWEVVHRAEAFKEENFTVLEVLNRVTTGYRPKIKQQFVSESLRLLLEDCWSSIPEKRPAFSQLAVELAFISSNYFI